MNHHPLSSVPAVAPDAAAAGLATHAAPPLASVFLRLLKRLAHGHLQLTTPHGTTLMFGDLHQPPSAQLHIRDWRACASMLRAGDIGFAECYANGWIDTPDLGALLSLAVRNQTILDRMLFGGRLATLWYRLRHLLRPNTRQGSRKNIFAHYDLGNPFYRLWLDSSWTYSSAWFAGNYAQSLESAQAAKYQRIIDQLGLCSGDRVLEIGCGWGGFAEFAALRGIHVHGVTISAAQLQEAQQRIARLGLQSLVQLELRDYRDIQGQYDAVVSIEMVEAVGERFWPAYFSQVAACLRPHGRALIQSITIAEMHFERYRNSSDFIREYIFPGGMLPSPERFGLHAREAGLSLFDKFSFGHDYAETLRRWHARFAQQREQIAAQGFDERFLRLWQLYFEYCAVGFDQERTDVIQFLLHKD